MQRGSDNSLISAMSTPGVVDDQKDGALPSYFAPSPTYVAPATGLLFSGYSPEESSLINFLPPKTLADRLLQQYWRAVHPIMHLVHRPTFETQYEAFWSMINAGFEPTTSVQALVFAVMFSAAVSLPETIDPEVYGSNRIEILRAMQGGCEYALSRSNVLRTSKVDVLQAFVIYLVSTLLR